MWAWARLLGPDDLFVDVGANVGTYSLWAASFGANVLALEPGDSIRRLRENVALNPGCTIEVVEAAAHARTGEAGFTSGGDTLDHLGAGRLVRTITLDDLLRGRRAKGVKIDVEGFERLVLDGAAESLRERVVDTWQLEWNSASLAALGEARAAVAEHLERAGYRPARPDEHGVLHTLPEWPSEGPDVFASL
jgi:FkbM family methyltransferase